MSVGKCTRNPEGNGASCDFPPSGPYIFPRWNIQCTLDICGPKTQMDQKHGHGCPPGNPIDPYFLHKKYAEAEVEQRLNAGAFRDCFMFSCGKHNIRRCNICDRKKLADHQDLKHCA